MARHIVSKLRASKTKRQFIFAIGVLHEEDSRARLQASGSLDGSDVKELAADILEGGKEAFNLRREKYGL